MRQWIRLSWPFAVAVLLLAGCDRQQRVTCPAPLLTCDGACLDLRVDPAHCGACDHACAAGQVCSAGACAATCAAPLVACGAGEAARCVAVQDDPANCGGCGTACGAGQVCEQGACRDACALGGGTRCGEACVQLATDGAHCGACDHACPAGQVCSAGACAPTCAAPLETCGAGAVAACADLRSDPAHCGACDVACGAGQLCAAGRCALSCEGGGGAVCGAACVQLASDQANCGACGHACPGATSCVAGRCQAPACAAGTGYPGHPDFIESLAGVAAVADLEGDALPDLAVAETRPFLGPPAHRLQVLPNLGGGRFGAPHALELPAGAVDIAAGDLDGDGLLDLAILGDDGQVHLVENQGGGSYALAPFALPTRLTETRRVLLADLDGDGRAELLVAGSFGVTLRRSSASGLGNEELLDGVDLGLNGEAIAVADVTGDGKLDLVTGGNDAFGRGALQVLHGDGAGGFGALDTTVTGELIDLEVGDLDGDGDLDVVAAHLDDLTSVQVLLNDGTGTFGAPAPFLAGWMPGRVGLGDFDGDGLPDVAALIRTSSEGLAPPAVVILPNLGGGQLGAPRAFASSAIDLVVVDLDRDGRRDVVGASTWVPAVEWLPGDGQGGLLAPLQEPLSQPLITRATLVADVDGDGVGDVVQSSGAFTVVRRGAPGGLLPEQRSDGAAVGLDLQAADLDGDGRADLLVLDFQQDDLRVQRSNGDGTFGPLALVAARVGRFALGDLDGDGRIDVVATRFQAGTGAEELAVFPGLGDGNFGAPVLQAVHGAPGDGVLADLAVRDLDGDGRPDVVALRGGTGDVLVFRNLGPAGLAAPVVALRAFGEHPSTLNAHLVAADLDGDGLADLAANVPTQDLAPDQVRVARNLGGGRFAAPVAVDAPFQPFGLASAALEPGREVVLVTGSLALSVQVVDLTAGGALRSRRWNAGGDAVSVGAGDVTGDLRPDLVVSSGQGAVAVLPAACLP